MPGVGIRLGISDCSRQHDHTMNLHSYCQMLLCVL
jgi:hypothetical protein